VSDAPTIPSRLERFDAADWLPLVDPAGYDPDEHRNIRDRVPVGPVMFPLEAWLDEQAQYLFFDARREWLDAHPDVEL
jgi:hypothetical protein